MRPQKPGQIWRGVTAQVLDGTVGQVISTSGDSLVGLDSRYASPPDVQWPLTFGNMAANVMLPLAYPNYTPEVRPSQALMHDHVLDRHKRAGV